VVAAARFDRVVTPRLDNSLRLLTVLPFFASGYREGVRSSLFSLIPLHAAHHVVTTQLALCLGPFIPHNPLAARSQLTLFFACKNTGKKLTVACVIQMESWKGAIADVVRGLENCSGCMLEVLQLIPEEIDEPSLDVSAHRRFSFKNEILDATSEVLRLLCRYATTNLKAVIKCATSWIYHSDVSGQELASSGLLNCALSSLDRPLEFESVVELLIEVVHRYQSLEPDHLAVIRVVRYIRDAIFVHGLFLTPPHSFLMKCRLSLLFFNNFPDMSAPWLQTTKLRPLAWLEFFHTCARHTLILFLGLRIWNRSAFCVLP